jgi:hypothetical protein
MSQHEAHPKAVNRISPELEAALKGNQLLTATLKDGKGSCPGCSQEVKMPSPASGTKFTSVPVVCPACKTEFRVVDQEEEEEDTEYELEESNGHTHGVLELNQLGSGKSTEDKGHSHRIAGLEVQLAKGHTHKLKKETEEEEEEEEEEDKPDDQDAAKGPKHADNGDEEGGIMNIPEAELVGFFVEHPNPTDDAFHDHSEKMGWNNHEAEAAAYKLATRYAQFRTDGASKGKRPVQIITSEEAMGQQVEKEHTPNIDDATKITWDHLTEVPNSKYYTFLELLEKTLKAGPGHPIYKKMMKLVEEAEELPGQH